MSTQVKTKLINLNQELENTSNTIIPYFLWTSHYLSQYENDLKERNLIVLQIKKFKKYLEIYQLHSIEVKQTYHYLNSFKSKFILKTDLISKYLEHFSINFKFFIKIFKKYHKIKILTQNAQIKDQIYIEKKITFIERYLKLFVFRSFKKIIKIVKKLKVLFISEIHKQNNINILRLNFKELKVLVLHYLEYLFLSFLLDQINTQ
jgi:hypothetical protein